MTRLKLLPHVRSQRLILASGLSSSSGFAIPGRGQGQEELEYLGTTLSLPLCLPPSLIRYEERGSESPQALSTAALT